MKKGISKKNCARYFEICKYAFFLIFQKGDEQKKNVSAILRFVSMLFEYLKKGMSKKIVLVYLRVVSMVFLIFEKGDEQKVYARYFEIRKCGFF